MAEIEDENEDENDWGTFEKGSQIYPAVQPPSIRRRVPVTIAAVWLERKTTAPMMSSTSPRRPSLILLSIQARRAGSARVLWLSGVFIKVGAIELTLTRCGPSSIAIDLVNPSIACLLAL